MEIELVIQSTENGTSQQARCQLDHRVVVGRGAENSVVIADSNVSREHLEIEQNDGRIFVSDRSSNGTWVNGNKLEKGRPREIHDGDLIEIPGYQIDFKVIAEAAALEPVAAEPHERAEVPEMAAPPVKKSLLAPVKAIVGMFSTLEKMLIVIALLSFWLGLYYFGG